MLIVANWKMNPQTEQEAAVLARETASSIEALRDAKVALCPPFPFLRVVKEAAPLLFLGAQDCFWEAQGAYTGEVSVGMLKEAGCSHVIVGHSERARHLGETVEMVNKKIRAVLARGLSPIICVGEEKEERQGTGELQLQLEKILAEVSREDMKNSVLVYEPVWAISNQGNYHPATPELVAERISLFRSAVSRMFGEEIGNAARILYGGSVNAENVKSFLKDGTAQGVLVGQASLNAAVFSMLVRNAIS